MTATTSQARFAVPDSEVARALPYRRRRITRELGRALERLDHAIEYLTDEYVHQCGSKAVLTDQVSAVLLLMTLRKLVYMDAPEVRSLGERCKTFLAQLLA
jgi:hypothetical protein